MIDFSLFTSSTLPCVYHFLKLILIDREEDVAYFGQKLTEVNCLVLPELFYQVSVLLFRKECF